MSEPARPPAQVRLEEVSIRYRMLHDRVTSLKEWVLRWIRRQHQVSDFWALRDISLTMNPGEVVGIVGANGAGKSTLLKVVARVLHPSSGRVRVRGVVAPILGLGTGFDPEMTGRENIYLNGAMLGFSRRQMNQKLEGLLAFAGLDGFIDAPLRTYSDGMVARLAFAIATDVEADLLLIDEILTVGDKDFNQKCLARMKAFKAGGTSILFVSHDLGTIEEICTRVIWLEHGRIRADGRAAEVLPRYQGKTVDRVFSATQVNDG